MNVNMSDIQVKQWAIALSKYDDAVLLQGWSQFLMKVRPGLMPSIEDCTKIMDDYHREHQRQRHEVMKTPIPEPKSGSRDGFTRWMKATTKGLAMRRKGAWTEIQRREFIIKEGSECGLPRNDLRQMQIDLDEYKRKHPDEVNKGNAEESPI